MPSRSSSFIAILWLYIFIAGLPAVFLDCLIAGELVLSTGIDSSEVLLPDSMAVYRPFHTGERLVYQVKFGPLKAGTAHLSLPQVLDYNGRRCYQAFFEINSNKTVSTFFHVEDRATSIIDSLGLFPWYYEKHVREGKYRSDRVAEFDHLNRRVYAEDDTIAIEPFSQDALSIFYYVRTLPLAEDKTFRVPSYSDKKFLPLLLKVHSAQSVRVPAGKYKCLLVEPDVQPGTPYKPKGKIWIWYSTDARRLIVKMRMQLAVGSIELELKEVH
ncbi:hypothetical protein A2V82_15765 [candidate division KSB1 bacterium RBG_16_48_16]|nr:MAG: hypothetical protein A2V82_15765 [candidate division KSB1 bacterium RBG_16_48_16]